MRNSLLTFALVALFSAVPFTSGAAPGAPQAGAPGGQGQMQDPAQRARALQQELVQIRSEALEANPDLAAREEEIGALVRETMRENGHTPEADLAKMGDIRETLQDGSVGAEERQALVTEFQELRATFLGARRQAMTEEAVQLASRAFQEDLVDAMRETDSRTDTLMQRMSQLQQQYGG